MHDKLVIASIAQTCELAPVQWEGKLTNGREFVIRYRHNRLSLRVSGMLLYQADVVRMDGDWDFELADALALIGCLEVSDAPVA